MHAVVRELSMSAKAYGSLPWKRQAWLPVLTGVVLGAMWIGIGMKLHAAHDDAVHEGLRRAGDIAHTFEQYSGRTVRQVDQVTRFVAFEFQSHGHNVPLNALTNDVLVAPMAPTLLSLADEHGMVYASSKPNFVNVSIADREHFRRVQDHPGTGLFVGKPVRGRVSHEVTVQAARGLTRADGTFGGAVVVSMAPQVFTNFYNMGDMGRSGFVGLAGLDGVYRASRIGEHDDVGPDVGTRDLLTQPMGTMLLGGGQTHDGQARFIGWRRLDGYDLVAVVGLNEAEVMAGYQAVWRTWVHTGILATLSGLLLAWMAMALYAQVEVRRQATLQAKDAYRTASEGTQDGFFILQPVLDAQGMVADFRVTDVNDRGARMFDVLPDVLQGTTLSRWFGGPMGKRLLHRYVLAFNTGSALDQPEVLVECDNPLQGRWVSHRVIPSPLGLAITVRDITQMKTHENSMRWLTEHDSVTDLHNRHWLQANLPVVLDHARVQQHDVGLFFVNLDDFKKINDALGHQVGDELLRVVGDRLTAMSRAGDLVCRIGGDEFTLVAQGTLSDHTLVSIGERILATLSAPMSIHGQTVTLGASVGVSVFPQHGEDADTLLQRADLAMYQAKDHGKGGCEFFEPSLAISADARLMLERDLRVALAHDELFLVYQPKVALHDGRLQGMEALLRWKSPTRGMVSPLSFIPMAERTGLILPIGDLVIEKACAQIAAWRAMGHTVPPVSVNVSPRQLHRVDVAEQLRQALERHGLEPAAIEVEITESSMMEDPELAQERLHAIKALGVRVLVDDFGTGYSSLAMLKRFEVDVLKVDRSFVKDVPHDAEDCAILQAVVSMAQALNMSVVAEGIETQDQCDFLRNMGCDEGQGYLFSPPIAPEDLVAWFKPKPTLFLVEASAPDLTSTALETINDQPQVSAPLPMMA